MGNAGAGFSASAVSTPIAVVPVTGANNGTSVSGGNVVLGQAFGAPGNPAALTSSRYIPLSNFAVVFDALVSNGTEMRVLQSGYEVVYDSVVTGYGSAGFLIADSSASNGQIVINTYQDAIDPTIIGYQISGPGPRILNTANGMQIAGQGDDFDPNSSGPVHIKSATCISEETAFVRRIGNTQTIFQSLDRYTSGTVFFNDEATAALNVQLPPAANNAGVWLTLVYSNATAGGSVVATPDGTDYIVIDTVTGAAGAAAQATLRGASITLVSDGIDAWIATAVVGTWTV